MTAVVFPWTTPHLRVPTGQVAKTPASTPGMRRMRRRLRAMLERDLQIRPRPPITLAGPGQPAAAVAVIPAAAAPPPPSIPTVLEAVAKHFHVPMGELIGRRHQGGTRPIALDVALALARTATGIPFVKLEQALDASHGSALDAAAKIAHLRKIDHDLARRLADIEFELGLSRREVA